MKRKFAIFIMALVVICSLTAIGYGGVHLYNNWKEQKDHEDELNSLQQLAGPGQEGQSQDIQGQGEWLENGAYIENGIMTYPDQFQIDWGGIDAINQDVVCWLYVPNSELSFPVVHPTSHDGDEYYTNHSYTGAYDIYGSIFIQSDNNLTDDNIIVYGHSTDVGSMFSTLVNWQDPDYFNACSNLYLYWKDGNVTHGQAINFYTCNIYSPLYSYTITDEQKELYSQPVDKVVTLSTCNLYYGLNSIQRIVVVFKIE